MEEENDSVIITGQINISNGFSQREEDLSIRVTLEARLVDKKKLYLEGVKNKNQNLAKQTMDVHHYVRSEHVSSRRLSIFKERR